MNVLLPCSMGGRGGRKTAFQRLFLPSNINEYQYELGLNFECKMVVSWHDSLKNSTEHI